MKTTPGGDRTSFYSRTVSQEAKRKVRRIWRRRASAAEMVRTR
ncbi:hypothetical protein HNQ71_004340 [Mesorhizobium sangaii]|uniref:Uncharacterized protein n=1 Tax=Mesorhizobium sangaii TaxID=505389 RepID=A0A841PNC1_9HYPH|nr:hypothetical protein [Mesorhizobium sangaii]